MLFQPPLYQQNKGEEVCFYPVISMYIYLNHLHILIMYVCILFICIYLRTWPILDSEDIGALFWAHFFRKKSILLAHIPQTDAIFNNF